MNRQEWIDKCDHWKAIWPVMQEEYRPTDNQFQLNIYAVLDAINQHSSADDILMGDAGSISYAGPVALNAKHGQRFIFSPAQADMGWALPAAVGASLASNQPVISIIGDGSFMSNVQELAVAKQHELDIKFVILNNNERNLILQNGINLLKLNQRNITLPIRKILKKKCMLSIKCKKVKRVDLVPNYLEVNLPCNYIVLFN